MKNIGSRSGAAPFQWLEAFADTIELNVLWLLCCIPIFTIGPATTAFYYSMIQRVLGDEGYVHRDFFRSFRKNFKQGALMGLGLLAVGGILTADLCMSYQNGTGVYLFLVVIFSILLVLWCFVALYTFPLLSKFENTWSKTLTFAFTLSIRHFPKTMLMILVAVVGIGLCHLLPGFILVVFGFIVRIQSHLLVSIFKSYLTPLAL